MTWLVVLGLLNSAIAIVYYVNVLWRMFAVEPAKRDRLAMPASVNFVMALAVIGIIALTVAFGVLLNHVNISATSLFTLH